MATVILGAGIIGVSTAYFLSEAESGISPSSIYLVESCPELFASASGFAGGFLARDWFSPASASLGALSFELHAQLAKAHGGPRNWGYSKTKTVSLTVSHEADDAWLEEGKSRVSTAPLHEDSSGPTGPTWLKGAHVPNLQIIDDSGGTAQVNPLRLCEFLLSKCRERGVSLMHPATATSVQVHTDDPDRDCALTLTVASDTGPSTSIPCKRLLLTAGAWTPRVFSRLFPDSKLRIPVSSLAGHSIVLRSPHWKDAGVGAGPGEAHAVYTVDDVTGYSPEIFARAGGELYIAGVNDAGLPLPDRATDRVIDPQSIDKLRATAARLLEGELADTAAVTNDSSKEVYVSREGLCWRSVTRSGKPIIDRLDVLDQPADGEGVWTAVGHGPWGISLSLGTGKVLSELVLGKRTSADISQLRL